MPPATNFAPRVFAAAVPIQIQAWGIVRRNSQLAAPLGNLPLGGNNSGLGRGVRLTPNLILIEFID